MIFASHVTEARTALNEARTILGLAALAFTDAALTPEATLIKAAHFLELRSGMR